MELRHLRYFQAVAEEANVTKAATRLRVAQPALSRQLRDLEEELGTPLLERERRGVRLTPAGETLARRARQILSDVNAAVRETRLAGGKEPTRLALGFLGSYHLEYLQPLLRLYREQHPDLDLDFMQGILSEQLEALRERRIDIAFVNLPAPLRELEHKIVHRVEFMAAVPDTHRLANRKHIELQELAKEDFVFCPREARPEFYDRVMGICADAGFIPRIVRTVGGPPNNVTGLVSLGLGVSLIPYFEDNAGSPNVVWIPLKPAAPRLEFALVWLAETKSDLVRSFVSLATEMLNQPRAKAPKRAK